MKKTAVVLFNLGGPDGQAAVQPFLFNLFSDKAIISLPQPLRWFVAKMISGKRAPIAQEIYQQLGGGSPILGLTQLQADALQKKLNCHSDQGASRVEESRSLGFARDDNKYKVFICMRYWHPMTDSVVQDVKNYAPDEIILLPLYPQFSTTTTGSSFKEWERVARAKKLSVPTKKICCYPMDDDFTQAHVELIRSFIPAKAGIHGEDKLDSRLRGNDVRILFSAHGLPEKVIKAGDPYQWQVEQSVAKIVEKLAFPELDYVVCYQSRVGPLKWIGPSTEEEIKRAGEEKKSLIIVPIAFVSEHSETLVELDIEYKHLAHEHGVPEYIRIPALATQEHFIDALASLCVNAPRDTSVSSNTGKRICPKEFCQCLAG